MAQAQGFLTLIFNTTANTSGINKTNTALKQIGKTSQQVAKQSSFLGAMLGKLGGLFNWQAGLNIVKGYVNFEKNLGAIQSRFYAVTGSAEEARKQFEFVRKTAKGVAIDIEKAADSYSIFTASAKTSMGLEGAQEVFENWSRVFRVLHINDAAQERIMYALREMPSKGQLYNQDLLIQMGTHVPDIRNIANEAIQRMGIKGVGDIEGFKKYTQKRQDPSLMGQFLIQMSRVVRERFGSEEALKKAMQQPDALLKQLVVTWQDFLIEFSQSGGSYALIKLLQLISKAVTSINWNWVAEKLGQMAQGLGNLIEKISSRGDIVISLLYKVVALLALQSISTKMGNFVTSSVGKGMLYSLNQGKFWSWIGLKILKPFGPLIGKGLVGFGTKMGLKTALASIVNAIPIIGQILSALLLLSTIIDLIRLIVPNKDKNNPNELYAGQFTRDQIAQAGIEAEELRKKGVIQSQNDLNRYISNAGLGNASRYFEYHDNAPVTIYNMSEGAFTDVNDWKHAQANKASNLEQAGGKGWKPTNEYFWGRK